MRRTLIAFGRYFFVVVLIVMSTTAKGEESLDIVGAHEAMAAAAAGEMTIVDIRSPLEWRMTGIPAGSVTATIHHQGGADGFIAEVLAAVDGDRRQPIALICAGGVRSDAAQQLLLANGFNDVHNVAEGMQGSYAGAGWLAHGLPVQPCPVC